MGVPLHPERCGDGLHRRPESADGTRFILARRKPAVPLQNTTERERLFTFGADILGNDRCDISMNLKLTERGIVKEVDGVMSVEAVPEPEAPDDAEEGWTVRRG